MVSEKAVWRPNTVSRLNFPVTGEMSILRVKLGLPNYISDHPSRSRTFFQIPETITYAKPCQQKWFESTNTVAKLSFPVTGEMSILRILSGVPYITEWPSQPRSDIFPHPRNERKQLHTPNHASRNGLNQRIQLLNWVSRWQTDEMSILRI